MEKHYDFFVSAYRFLNEQGELDKALPDQLKPFSEAVKAYEIMAKVRGFDQKAVALQRTGKLGTYPSVLGQEAIGTAIGMAMSTDDVFVPYYRDQATQYLRGVSLKEQLLYWGGDERGSAFSQCEKDFPNCVPIATQICHAAGAASAIKIRGEKHAVVATLGDGATSKADFLESLNLAGTWHLPLILVVNNNQWAISTRREVQSASETIAQKAIGAGIEGVQVDGNDYFAMRFAMNQALEKAYSGKGPTLIEAISYRLSDHTTADDATRYRENEELRAAWQREPVMRLRNYLVNHGVWNDTKEKRLMEEVSRAIDAEVEAYLKEGSMPPESMFDCLYEELPPGLMDQYVECKYTSAIREREEV